MSVEALNALDEAGARARFERCCVSRRWIEGMLSARPYGDADAVRRQACESWQALGEKDWLEAFSGHPRIGDVTSLRARYAASAELAAGEQSGVAAAGDDVLEGLARGNAAYEERFGFIFIVCATGRSADEMYALLKARLANDRATELAIAADEQLKILLLRLEQLL
jgi:2-oxo-4-hydroxy-4-carboxy-5-ureidoimidazoline decarboxylase